MTQLLRGYRGKRVDNNKWVYGWYVEDPVFSGIFEFEGGDWPQPLPHIFHIDRNTVGQWSGLYDKNGTKIYEGDILKGKSKRTFIVEYKEEICTYMAIATDDNLITPMLNKGTLKNYEVIGNIYDNPELSN